MVSSGENNPLKSMVVRTLKVEIPDSMPSYSSSFSVENSGSQTKAKDLFNVDFGRLKLNEAEVNLPGLMKCRTKFGSSQPLKDLKIAGSLNVTPPNGVLIELISTLGTQVKLCSISISSTDEHVAAAIKRDSGVVFALECQTHEESWSCKASVLDFGTSGGPHLILDHCGNLPADS
ncbi:hypothetical protein POM88_027885 [Heracleum sosnowskyi]|uniref:Adenosylhomocysteinase n=1 Tax=Heracleum sosnowskyi TaxID=360622 RepID=A0AAD8I8T6_9APIA|nr:hypothetical protein POM88_027885 [Heracleum sosnowskyi]